MKQSMKFQQAMVFTQLYQLSLLFMANFLFGINSYGNSVQITNIVCRNYKKNNDFGVTGFINNCFKAAYLNLY